MNSNSPQTRLKDIGIFFEGGPKKWGSHGHPSRPYGAGPAVLAIVNYREVPCYYYIMNPLEIESLNQIMDEVE